MNKKFLSVILFSALMVGTAGTFTSCKDYDDDIKNLQEQLGKKASLEELAAKVSTLETAVNDAKTAANEAKDKAQEALDKMLFQEAKEAIDNQTFVLEADRVYFKYGTSAFVSSNTNFVGLDGDKAVVQVAFNVPFSGPNGLGGITVDGNASNYKVKTDKKGNIHVSMNVMGIGISAQVNIDIPYGSNNATVDILPNFNSSHMTLSGQILPLKKANVFKGRSL